MKPRLPMLRVAMAWTLMLWLPGMALAIDPLAFKTRADEVRFQHLTGELRCLVCQNESLADSDADLAKDLRSKIFELMQEGRSDEEIKHYLTSRYSDFVLYDPPVKRETALLWLGPYIVLALGVIKAGAYVAHRSNGAQNPTHEEGEW